MSEANISYAFLDKTGCVIKLSGAIKYATVAPSFEQFIDELSTKTEVNNIVIDMRDCTYIDSTDLGLLARIALYQINKKDSPQPVIVYKQGSDIQKILEDIGFSRVFKMVNTLEVSTENFTTVENTGVQNELNMAKLMIDSHEKLLEIDPENEKKFSTVIRLMKENLTMLEENGDT
ncbi:STAS domain-containing protein [Chitinivibrio alkaliphilus]|uniref:Anti-sigma-factor antagonist n=1 Tax=Chitinivibrio alkaliphilus ACht1 TaxID=1313304 RepID=U7DBD0_9BACT|nr:STAS domain-containing protein [Chitinivibrio alkaliphilus]ERP39317.1 anti-sigma-factor antagonist [Chitinivibrio alkaliphilus ACht1]